MRRPSGVSSTVVVWAWPWARIPATGPRPSGAALALALGLGVTLVAGAGCSTTGNGNGGGGLGRPRVLPGVKTVTSVGDKPSTVVAGLSGDSYTTDVELPTGRDRAQGRITGRVLDDRGRPVPGAEVRLADGTTPYGRNVAAVTDDSGAFTLRELRPGTRYTLIAETGDGGPSRLGRAVAEAPESDIRIRLASAPRRTAGDDPDRVDRASQRRRSDDGAGDFESDDPPAPKPRPRVNADDLPDDPEAIADPVPAPRRSARPAADDPDPAPVPRTRPASSARKGVDPWRSTGPEVEPAGSRSNGRVDLPEPDRARSAYGLPYDGEDGDNPLPPARERQDSPRDDRSIDGAEPVARTRSAPSRSGSGSGRGDTIETFTAAPTLPAESFAGRSYGPEPEPGAIARAPEIASRRTEPAAEARRPAAGAPPLEAAAPTPAPAPESRPLTAETFESTPATTPRSAASEPAPAGMPPSMLPAVEAPEIPPDVLGPAAAAGAGGPRPTWSQLTAQSTVGRGTSYPTSTRRIAAVAPSTDGSLAPASATRTEPAPGRTAAPDPTVLAGRPGSGSVGSVASAAAAAPPMLARGPSKAIRPTARFDAATKRLVDFELPDLQGQPVHFRDLDSDLILIDFWGTWCSPCLRTIPRLVELQDRYDPSQLQIVGVAYEQQPSHEARARSVEQTMRRLGVNYPVLLGTADGDDCPLQAALNVKAYPTLILLSRDGRILWRDSGGSPSVLERLDRVISANTGQLARDSRVARQSTADRPDAAKR